MSTPAYKIENKVARRGNPSWIKGGPSPNPGGVPSRVHALVLKLHERYGHDFTKFIDRLEQLAMQDEERAVALAATLAVLHYGCGKPMDAEQVARVVEKAMDDGVIEMQPETTPEGRSRLEALMEARQKALEGDGEGG